MHKKVKYNLPAQEMDMDGFPIKQAIPTQQVRQIDPYLLLHHAQVKYSNRKQAKHQGVGPHPHRGFSPVTFVIAGEVHHRDSFGHNQIAKAGEVQWMHAGAGIVHSERPSEALIQGDRRQEIIQLWINSPASKKMKPPTYQHITKKVMPLIQSEDGKIENRLITGTYKEESGPAISQSENLIIWSYADENGQDSYHIPSGHETCLYVIKGGLKVEGYGLVEAESLLVFEKEGSIINIRVTHADTQLLILSGRPIAEKIEQFGPYVMNTQTQIMEAMRDYQIGKMGILIEE